MKRMLSIREVPSQSTVTKRGGSREHLVMRRIYVNHDPKGKPSILSLRRTIRPSPGNMFLLDKESGDVLEVSGDTKVTWESTEELMMLAKVPTP